MTQDPEFTLLTPTLVLEEIKVSNMFLIPDIQWQSYSSSLYLCYTLYCLKYFYIYFITC